jgi:hypothetical protein
MESLLPLIIQLASGALGGNVAGALFKNLSLGTLWNSVAGVAGGGIGGFILNQVLHLGPAAGGLDIGSILTQVAGGGVGGGGLMALIGLARSMMAK